MVVRCGKMAVEEVVILFVVMIIVTLAVAVWILTIVILTVITLSLLPLHSRIRLCVMLEVFVTVLRPKV